MSDTTIHTVFDDEHDGREDQRTGGEVVPFARAAREQDRTTTTRRQLDAGETEVPDVLGDLADEHDMGSASALVQPDRSAEPATGDAGDEDDIDDDHGDEDRGDGRGGRELDAAEGGDFDRESVVVEGVVLGRAVDPPDDAGTAPWRRAGTRPPVVPAALRSVREFRLASRWAARSLGWVVAFHGLRAPKYVALNAWFAPVGAFRTAWRLVRWSTAETHNWGLRQSAADRNDAELWLKLDRQRQHQTSWRTWVLGFTAVATLAAALTLAYGPIPSPARVAVLVVLVLVLARVGRPADRPILEHVHAGPKYRKLTADLVRRGLLSLGVAGITQAVAKDPHAISFPTEIHRDGPGHLALVDLPYGVEAADVIARRGRLASALRLPLDQVWPEPAPGHPGRLALWVGHEPASQMRQPKWALAAPDARVDVFTPFPIATTPRMDVVTAELMFRNWLIGGQPGSGKTFLLRNLLLAASLDPRVELRGYGLKGVGDFSALEPVSAEFGEGADDETIARAAALIDWLYEECRRRGDRIRHYAKLGKAPENKVTPELAGLAGSGLHPLVAWFDEIQELFTSRLGKDAGVTLEKVIKLGRALGIVILIGTQIPDKDSLPTGITRNVNTRYCMSVADQVANDMILGTSAYKLGLRATVFEPVTEAGWGILRGIGKPGARRSFYADNDAAARIVARAVELRRGAGTLVESPATRQLGAGYDVLADVLQIWPAGEDKAWNETLLPLLFELRPDVYAGWEPAQLTAALKPHGIDVGQVGRRIDGRAVTRRGPAHADLLRAVAERDRRKRDA